MINLSNLLERFSKSLNKDSWTKETILSTILEKTRVNLPQENVFLKDGVLEIRASASAKNEIMLKEESIKTELKERYQISFSRIIYK